MSDDGVNLLVAGESGLFLESFPVILKEAGFQWRVTTLAMPVLGSDGLGGLNGCHLLIVVHSRQLDTERCLLSLALQEQALPCPVLFLVGAGEALPGLWIQQQADCRVMPKSLSLTRFVGVLNAMLQESGHQPAPQPPRKIRLTPRQRDILAALTTGQSNKEIARALDISHNTVRVHLAALFQKLKVKDRRDAIRMAGQLDLAGRDTPGAPAG